MNIIRKITNSKYSYIFGLFSFVLYTVSFLIGHEEESANHMLVLVKAVLIFASAMLYLISCSNSASDKIKEQFSILSLIILIYQIILWAAVGRTIIYIRDYPAIGNGVIWTLCSIICIIRFRRNLAERIMRIFTNRDTLFLFAASALMAVIVMILSGGPGAVRFTWDSDTMYAFIYRLEYDSLFDVRQLLFYNHVSVIYCYLLVMFKLAFSDIRLAFWLVNSLCATAASFGTTFLLRSLVPGRKNIEYVLSSALFVFSPWVCGMSTYFMYDYYIWCLYPLMIYFLSRHKWLGFFAIGTMISFSRSPGLIVFGGVCAGIVILDLIRRRKLTSIVADMKYWFFGSVALVYFIFYRTIDQQEELWGSFYGMDFGIDTGHIFHYIKMYTITNFLWIFFILTVALIVMIRFKKSSAISFGTTSVISAALIGDTILFVFYCLVITYRLPRYLDSHVAIMYICAAVFLLGTDKRKLANILSGLILIVTFIGSYRTIDPVSKLAFATLNVGDHTTVDFEMKERATLGDSIVFSREYYSYQILLDKVLTDVIGSKKDGDEIMISTNGENITWGVSGGRYSYGYADNKKYFDLFYDKTINGLANGYEYAYFDSSDMIPFKARFVFPQENVSEAAKNSSSDRFFYIYMPTHNLSAESPIYDDFHVEDEKQYEYGGWKINCITFTKGQ